MIINNYNFKNRLVIGILLFLFYFLAPTICLSTYIEPKQYSIFNDSFDKPFAKPLNFVELVFEDAIEIKEDAKAFIAQGNVEIITSSSFENRKLGNESLLTIFFDGECLPKGETYTFHLKENSVCLSENSEIINSEFSRSFSVPADVGKATFNFPKDSNIIAHENIISCSWMYEVYGVGNPQWKIYRENELVRTYPADINSDWDLGSAFLDFKEYLNFENDIHFRLVLPAGSVRAARPDITNEEVVLDFIGGYHEPINYPSYYWCDLYEDIPSVIHDVSFYFKEQVSPIPGKPVILTGVNGNECKNWNVFPYIFNDGDNWILKADFEGIELDPEWEYTVSVPEGTVVTANGDIAVNYRQSVSINNRSAGTDIVETDLKGSIPEHGDNEIYNFEGLKVQYIQPGKIYILNGKKVVIR